MAENDLRANSVIESVGIVSKSVRVVSESVSDCK